MKYETISLEKKETIATITLNRPEKLNAFNPKMQEELLDVFAAVEQDNEVRVVVITGVGRAFSAGADIQESFLRKIEERKKGIIEDVTQEFVEVGCLALARITKPVIASINGPAIGLGCTFCLACDIRIASESATFSFAFPSVGVTPEFGSTYFLPRLVGIGKACELMFTAKMIDAKEAKEIGLVNLGTPAGELTKTTYEMASSIAKLAPLAIRISKKALYLGMNNDLSSQLRHEALALNYICGTEDHEEGAKAFLDKREPIFRGR